MKVSHTQLDKWRTCPLLWKFHYVDKVRSRFIGSALFFGTACDEAFSRLLLEKKIELDDEERTCLENYTPRDVFDKFFNGLYFNRDYVHLPTSNIVQYTSKDYTPFLLQQEDIERLEEYANTFIGEDVDVLQFLDDLVKDKKENGWSNFTEDYIGFYNLGHWLCLRRKGHMLVDTYEKEFMPKVNKVFSIQKRVNLPNVSGDTYIGLIDFTAEFVDEPGIIRVCDNKTSSKNYKADSVKTSEQLMSYCEHEANFNGCFVVFLKDLREVKVKTCQKCGTVTERRVKKCPENKKKCGGEFDIEIRYEVKWQLIRDEVDDSSIDELFTEIQHTVDDMKNENHQYNKKNKKDCWVYGKPCCYTDVCHNNAKPEDDIKLIVLKGAK